QNISWTTAGTVGNVKIEYSTDNGIAWAEIVNSTTNDGSHPWTVPNTPSSQCQVRISDVADVSSNSTSDAVFTIKVSAPPTISLNITRLNFGAEVGDVSTSSQITTDQKFRITNTGEGILNWTVTNDVDWIMFSNTTTAEFSATQISGVGDAVINVSVDPSGYSAGILNGTITVSDPNSSNLSQTVNVVLTVKDPNDSDPPFGFFDTPLDGSVVSGSIAVTGWALDDIEVKHVEIKRDPDPDDNPGAIGSDGLVHIGYAFLVKGSRTDVEALYQDYPLNDRAGWGYMMLTFGLPRRGNGSFRLYAFAEDVEGKSALLGIKDISADNANRVNPFGTIDTPGPGQVISGSAYVNFGWALTPPASTNKFIPYDGSTVYWSIDSVIIGSVDYGDNRTDIAGAFPECLNANTAGGHKYIDTTQYANGVHTIGWLVYDNENNGDGMGSRFFEIQNTGATALEMTGMDSIKYKEDFSGSLRIDIDGPKEIELEELGYLKLELKAEGGKKIIGWGADKTKNLPIGSTLEEENGTFYWMPGIGFLNRHVLHFAVTDGINISQPVEIIVNIVPKRYEKGNNEIKIK
ncbi:MAG: Ig-like domain-containing protein, partial [Candidatus Aminicenantes bacterium]|nr:Ig-like domain-containing protein [Candidatus Aminicenantes bacterium]